MRWRFVIPLVIFMGFVGLFVVGFDLNPRAIPSPLVGKPAPFFSLPRFDQPDQMVTPEMLRGKPYLLNVWATWCVSCRMEHPELMRLAGEGVRIVGFNYKEVRGDASVDARRLSPEAEREWAWARIEEWLQKGGNPYDVVVVDLTGRSAIDYGVYGTPETFFVDAEGIIRHKQVGPISRAIWEGELRAKWLAIAGGEKGGPYERR
ncbi:MAG: DsbE family thiol:disulfide interchange protein [Hydrogenophilus sp.]|nr:DsbE family thiol:disulfide interchange protein [Hydrogenophilus sp.]